MSACAIPVEPFRGEALPNSGEALAWFRSSHAIHTRDACNDVNVPNRALLEPMARDDAIEAREHCARRVVLTLPQFYGVGLAVSRGELLAAVPEQFARVVAGELDLAIYQPPFPVPVPEISLYGHRRHEHEPAHCWLREQVAEATWAFA